ncbi:MAG: hypothetical protein RSA70_08075, partial [Clostridia bacterium]
MRPPWRQHPSPPLPEALRLPVEPSPPAETLPPPPPKVRLSAGQRSPPRPPSPPWCWADPPPVSLRKKSWTPAPATQSIWKST